MKHIYTLIYTAARTAQRENSKKQPTPKLLRDMAMREPVLLVDFAVYKPPEELKVDYLAAQDASKQWQVGRLYMSLHMSCYHRTAAVLSSRRTFMMYIAAKPSRCLCCIAPLRCAHSCPEHVLHACTAGVQG